MRKIQSINAFFLYSRMQAFRKTCLKLIKKRPRSSFRDVLLDKGINQDQEAKYMIVKFCGFRRIILSYHNHQLNKFNQTHFKQQIEHIAVDMHLHTARFNTQIGKPNSYNNNQSRRRIKTQLDDPYIVPQSRRAQQTIRQQTKSQLQAINIQVAPMLMNKSSCLERPKCKTYYNNFGKASCLIRPKSTANHIVRLGNSTHRKTQRQKFIDILQKKILNSDSNSKPRYKTVEDIAQKQKTSHRYTSIQRQQDQLHPNSQTAKDNPDARKQLDAINHIKKQSLDQNKLQENKIVRNRSKTFTKQLANNFNAQSFSEQIVNQISKTIQIESLKIPENINKSSHKITKINLSCPSENVASQRIIDKLQTIKDTQREDMNDSTIKDTEAYNEQIKHLTNDFFIEWHKMNLTKSQIYQQLRNKFVKKFPGKRKHYARYKLPEEEQDKSNLKKKQSMQSYNIYNGDISSIRISQNYLSFNKSQSNQLLESQVKGYQDKYEVLKQQKLLKQIFKQACFWSRTKNRFMSEYTSIEEIETVKDLNQIKKRLTFMSYIKDKQGKGVLKCKNKIRGSSIIRNKDSILELEKQGSREQIFLKKCLDDAIEDCLQDSK